MKQFLRHSTIIIWGGLTIYTLIRFLQNQVSLTDNHYINFILIGIAVPAHIFSRKLSPLVTLLTLFIGFIGRASFTPACYFFFFGSLSFSWPYLSLIVYCLIVDRHAPAAWINGNEGTVSR